MGTINVPFRAYFFLFLFLSLSLSRTYQMRSFLNKQKSVSEKFPKAYSHVFSPHSKKVFCTELYSAQKATRNGLGKPKGYWDVKARYVLEHHNLSGLPDLTKPFLVLGIESSCDDTGAAIVRSDGTILSNVVYSQYEIHEKFGGIVPSLAMEAHKGNIERAVSEAVKQAGLSGLEEIDAIAVTRGPGLEICLRVGFKKAQALAHEFNKPFVCVHHLEAHCVMARLAGKVIVPEVGELSVSCSGHEENYESNMNNGNNGNSGEDNVKRIEDSAVIDIGEQSIGDDNITQIETGRSREEEGEGSIISAQSSASVSIEIEKLEKAVNDGDFTPKVDYPFLALLASGGHTSILLCKNLGDYEVLGGTLDDALGEAFDKAARILGLKSSTSGGAAVEAMALKGDQDMYPMTIPMRSKLNCDFSYAGLKNAFRLAVQVARGREGLDVESTNAPANQMEEAPELVTLSDASTADLCASFQSVAFSHVEDRLKHALNYVDDHGVAVTSLVVVGGVAANKELRRRLLDLLALRAMSADSRALTISLRKGLEPTHEVTTPVKLIFPPPGLCTDNGVMVAWAGIEKIKLGISDDIDGQEVIARWPLGSPIEDGQATFRKGGLRN